MLTDSDEEEEGLPSLQLPCQIVYCGSEEAANRLCQPLLQRLQEERVFAGFDAEWPVTMRRGEQGKLALLQVGRVRSLSAAFLPFKLFLSSPQICTGGDRVLLFHLAAIGGLPEALRDVVQHRNFVKLGVNVAGDVWKLARDFSLPEALACVQNSCVDLGELAKEVGAVQSGLRWSLQALVAAVLRADLPKEEEVRCGSWDAVPLPAAMRRYAALDAFASWRLHEVLAARR